MSKRKSNEALLKERLFKGFVQRKGTYFGEKAKTVAQKLAAAETSQLQGMARHFARELEALSRGAGECKSHPDLVEGACPCCEGLWVEGT